MACVSGPLPAIDADLLIIPWFQNEAAAALSGVDAATGGELARALETKEFQAKPYELFFATITGAGWRARRVAFIGGGSTEPGTDLLRKLATAAGLAARQRAVKRVAFLVRGRGASADLAQAAAEGLTLAEFYGGTYKTDDPPPAAVPAWTIVALDEADGAGAMAQVAVERGRILGECSNLARELANEPGNTLTPREFAKRADGAGERGRRPDRDSRRDADREARHGTAAGCRARQRRAAAPDGVPLRSAGRAADAGARPRRQGHHLRHRRHLDQAGRQAWSR